MVLEVVGSPTVNDDGISVTFNAIKADLNLYEWDWQTEEGDGPSNGPNPILSSLPQPSITSATPFFDTVSSGALGVRVTLNASGPSRDDLTWS